MQQTMIEHAVQIPPLGLSADLVVPAGWECRRVGKGLYEFPAPAKEADA